MDKTKVGDLMNNPALWSMVGGLGAALSPKDTWARDLGSFTSNVFSNAAYRKNMLEAQGKPTGDLKSLLDYGFTSPEQQLATYKESPEYLEAEQTRKLGQIGATGEEHRKTLDWQDALKNRDIENASKYKLPAEMKKALSGTGIENLGDAMRAGVTPESILSFQSRANELSMLGRQKELAQYVGLLETKAKVDASLSEIKALWPQLDTGGITKSLDTVIGSLGDRLNMPKLEFGDTGDKVTDYDKLPGGTGGKDVPYGPVDKRKEYFLQGLQDEYGRKGSIFNLGPLRNLLTDTFGGLRPSDATVGDYRDRQLLGP